MPEKPSIFLFSNFPFTKESHYLILTLILSISTTVFFHRFPTSEFIENFSKNSYVMFFSGLPATSFPDWIKEIDTTYWENYYRLQFSTMPIHFFLGFLGSFFSPKDRFENLARNVSWGRIFLGNFFFLATLILIVISPQINEGYPIPINYWDDKLTLPTLIITWIFAALIFHGTGSGLSAPIKKFIFGNIYFK